MRDIRTLDLKVLRATDLLAVAPRHLVAGIDGLALLKPPLQISGFTKIVARHDRTYRDAAHRWIRTLLFETSGVKIAREKRP